MSQPMTVDMLLSALEDAFQEIRSAPAPLAFRLKHIASEVRRLSPQFADAVETFVGRLETAGAGASAPQVGEPMPPFTMPDETGKLVSLDELLANGPVAVAFHRGHWCPYCRLNMVGLAEIQDRAAPVQIVAVSAETRRYTRELKAEAGAAFPFLTDMDNGYALSMGLAIWVDDAMSKLIAAAGWDVPRYQNGEAWILPIPSVFLVSEDGIVRGRHIDPDYRRRMEPADLLAMIDAHLGRGVASAANT